MSISEEAGRLQLSGSFRWFTAFYRHLPSGLRNRGIPAGELFSPVIVEIWLTGSPHGDQMQPIYPILPMKINAPRLVSPNIFLLPSVIAVAVLCSLASVSGGPLTGQSVLEEARSDSAFFSNGRHMEGFRSSDDSLIGALTLNNVYAFDFARAGIGTLIFRAESSRIPLDLIPQDMPRPVGGWASESDSFSNLSFSGTTPFYRGTGRSLAFDDQSGTDPLGGEVIAAPETSTWIAGALALGMIGFTQRRRIARRFAS